MLVNNLCAFKAGPGSWKRLQLTCKIALSVGDSLVVDD